MISRDKPKGVWDTEWVAMHTVFHFPEVADAEFLAEFKKVMIEVAGDRLYDYRAAEQVDERLIANGLSCPLMEKEAAAEGFARRSKIKDFIRLQMDVLHSAADKWRAQIPIPKGSLAGVPPELIERFKREFPDNGKPAKVDFSDLLERSIRERNEEYARRNSPEALAAKEKEYGEWWAVLDFANVAVQVVKKAIAASNPEEVNLLGKRLREALLHARLPEKPWAGAALHRAMGLVEEAGGRIENAVAEYKMALSLYPKVGCQRDLKRLA